MSILKRITAGLDALTEASDQQARTAGLNITELSRWKRSYGHPGFSGGTVIKNDDADLVALIDVALDYTGEGRWAAMPTGAFR